MEDLPKRIHIIGPSGTGKTTLAERVAERIGAEAIKLDEYDAKPMPELAKDPTWVTEGIYTTVTPLLENADQIVWMDYPLHINLSRVTKRYFKYKLTGKDKWGFVAFLKLLHRNVYFSTRKVHETSGDPGDITPTILENFLRPYQEKLVRIRNNQDYKKYLDTFGKY